MQHYRKIRQLDGKSDFEQYHELCGNNAIRDAMTYKALEYDRKDTLQFLAKNFFYDKKDLLEFAKYRHYNLFYILLEKFEKQTKDLLSNFKKIDQSFVDAFCEIVYQNYDSYNIIDDMEGLQKTLLFFKEKSIEIKSSFFKRLLKLYEKRIERAKKTLFYYSLLVVCNPKHPIGYRFIMKEYNDLYESEALRIGK